MDGEKFVFLYIVFTFGQIVTDLISDVRHTKGDGNTSFIIEAKNDKCFTINTCEYAKRKYAPNCYCDHLCHTFDDCCIDHIVSEEIILQHDDMTDIREKMECMQLYGPYLGVYVMRNCSDQKQNFTNGTYPEITNNTLFDVIPVTSQHKIVYRNMFIAECNDDMRYEFWKLRFDISSCASGMRIKSSGMSTFDVATVYFQEGCKYSVTPPDDKPPRFCIIFNPTGKSTQWRNPIINVDGVYRNKETCEKFHPTEKCQNCYDYGPRGGQEVGSHDGTSMNALFQFRQYEIAQETHRLDKTAASAEVVFRNIKLVRQLRATTSSTFEVQEWDRASFFYQACIKRALIDFEPYLKFTYGIYLEKYFGSNESLLTGDIVVFIRKELHSHIVLAEIENWFDGHRIQYSEVSESRSVTFDITTDRIEKALNTCSDISQTCSFLGRVRLFFENSDIVELMRNSKYFPANDCLEIFGRVEILKDRKSFRVTCKTPQHLLIRPTEISLMSIYRYAWLSVSSIFSCTVFLCYRKGNLHNTIFGYSYLLLLVVSFLNLAITTFVENYPLEMCWFMKLSTRFLTLIVLIISIICSITFIYFMVKIKSSTNQSFLKNKSLLGLLVGSSFVIPLALTYLIHQFIKHETTGTKTCDLQFLSRDNFTDATCTLEIILVIIAKAVYIVYMKKGKEISLIKECLRYVFAYEVVLIENMVNLILQYLAEYVDVQLLSWVYITSNGIQIPILVILLYFRN